MHLQWPKVSKLKGGCQLMLLFISYEVYSVIGLVFNNNLFYKQCRITVLLMSHGDMTIPILSPAAGNINN